MREKLKNSILYQVNSFAVLMILILLGAYMITGWYSSKILRSRTIEMNRKILMQVDDKAREVYNNASQVATALVYSPTAYEYFTMDSVKRVMASETLTNIFSNTLLLDNGIAGIYFYDTSMNRIAEMGKSSVNTDFVKQLKQKMEFGNSHIMEQAGMVYYPVYFPVYDLENSRYGVQIGMCVIIRHTENLDRILDQTQATEHTQVYLIDGNNRILASRGGEDLEILSREYRESSKEFYVTSKNLQMEGWRVVSRIPERELNSTNESGRTYVMAAYVLAVILIVSMVIFFIRRIVRPVHQIDNFIRELVSEPGKRMEIEREDEIGTVVRSLNQMLDRQQQMNQEVRDSQKRMYEAELAKKQLQVLAYRNQINPHFLYNTFECICAMALYHDVEDIAEITMSLSKVFRFAVKGENIVSVAEEVSYIREYANIIDYRFMGKIDVDVDMEEGIQEKRVIKLMLQPLVENAVFHGLEQKTEGGEVNVSIRMAEEKHLCFCVEDNGCGIEPSKLVWMRDNLESQVSGSKGIGVANIYQRLKLFYGNDVVFKIESKLGEGTKITIIIPDEVKG